MFAVTMVLFIFATKRVMASKMVDSTQKLGVCGLDFVWSQSKRLSFERELVWGRTMGHFGSWSNTGQAEGVRSAIRDVVTAINRPERRNTAEE